MPNYALKCCGCGHCFEQFAKVSERSSIVCPLCKTAGCDIDCSNLNIAINKTFGRSRAPDNGVSMQFGFHPDEVADARRELPNWKIDSETGDVYVENGKHNARMMKDLENMRSRESARRAQEGISDTLDSASQAVTVPKRRRIPERTKRAVRQGRHR